MRVTILEVTIAHTLITIPTLVPSWYQQEYNNKLYHSKAPMLLRRAVARAPKAVYSRVRTIFTAPQKAAIQECCSQEEIDTIVSNSRSLLLELGNENNAMAARFAEERLRGLAMQRGFLPNTVGVLFLCGHNAGRSQMAAFMAQRAADLQELDFVAFSGGSVPGTQVNPVAIDAMMEIGIDMQPTAFPKPWTSEVGGSVACVITMGCGDQCPVVPGTRVVDWKLPDPHGEGIEMVRKVRDEISEKVDELILQLRLR